MGHFWFLGIFYSILGLLIIIQNILQNSIFFLLTVTLFRDTSERNNDYSDTQLQKGVSEGGHVFRFGGH